MQRRQNAGPLPVQPLRNPERAHGAVVAVAASGRCRAVPRNTSGIQLRCPGGQRGTINQNRLRGVGMRQHVRNHKPLRYAVGV